MLKQNIKLSNHLLFAVFVIWVIVLNITKFPEVVSASNIGTTVLVISIVFGAIMGLVGMFVAYKLLERRWGPIYWIFIALAVLGVMNFFVEPDKSMTAYLSLIFLKVPMIVLSVIALKYQKLKGK